MNTPDGTHVEREEARWAYHLAYLASGFLLFETVTGLSIYLLPFSVTNQFSVILHTLIGIPFILPLVWYLIRHWSDCRTYTMNHYKATGYKPFWPA